ncbi:hypothetical protein, partial [Streptobacillus moniliformis]
MKFTYKEYMALKGIKSRNTLKKYVREGSVKEVKGEDGKLYIIDTQIDTSLIPFETQSIKSAPKIDSQNDIIKLLNFETENQNKKIKELEQEIKILNIQLENKNNFISRMEEEIKEDKLNYQRLFEQISETNKTYQLLLENK